MLQAEYLQVSIIILLQPNILTLTVLLVLVTANMILRRKKKLAIWLMTTFISTENTIILI